MGVCFFFSSATTCSYDFSGLCERQYQVSWLKGVACLLLDSLFSIRRSQVLSNFPPAPPFHLHQLLLRNTGLSPCIANAACLPSILRFCVESFCPFRPCLPLLCFLQSHS